MGYLSKKWMLVVCLTLCNHTVNFVSEVVKAKLFSGKIIFWSTLIAKNLFKYLLKSEVLCAMKSNIIGQIGNASYFGSSIYETNFAVCNIYQKVTVSARKKVTILALKKSYRFNTEKFDNKHLDLQICHGKTKMNFVL